jgi:hypothetical protein
VPGYYVIEILGAVALGGFVGLDRRLAGARHAISAHAAISIAGLALILFCEGILVDGRALAIVVAGLLVVISLFVAMAVSEGAGLRALLSRHGDPLSLGCALAVGVACGTGFGRAVAFMLLAAVAVSIFRPRGVGYCSPQANERVIALAASASIREFMSGNRNLIEHIDAMDESDQPLDGAVAPQSRSLAPSNGAPIAVARSYLAIAPSRRPYRPMRGFRTPRGHVPRYRREASRIAGLSDTAF